MVVIGDGAMQFTPKPAMEQTQLRIFSGETELRAPIGAAFLRYHPVDRDDRISGTLTEEPVSASSLRKRARPSSRRRSASRSASSSPT